MPAQSIRRHPPPLPQPFHLPFDLLPLETPAAALDAVRSGAADAALVDAITARLYLRDHAAWDAASSPVTDTLFALVTRGDRPEVAAQIDIALAELFADGTVAAIIDRWL